MKGPATAAALVALLGTPAAAHAGNGGASYDGAKAKRMQRTAARPVLSAFAVAPAVLEPGATPSVTFRVDARTRQVRLRLVASWPDTKTPQRVVDLGRQPSKQSVTLALTQLADRSLPEGAMSLRIAGRDTAGRLLRPAAHLSRVRQVEVRAHVFPLVGTFSYGDDGARFGAPRNGHTHQGQDMFAAEGTPVVSVRSGTVDYVEYQAGGAGWYVVVSADGEDFDYAYMHLKEGSIVVVKGQHVDTGQRLGDVGHTGDAQGNHLHFEVWQGAWFAGGKAVDPLPFLQLWQQWSPVRAT